MTDQNEAEKCHACKGEGFLDTGDACDACCETGLCDPAAEIDQLRTEAQTLADEVREWRQMFAPDRPLQRGHQVYAQITQATDASGALTRHAGGGT